MNLTTNSSLKVNHKNWLDIMSKFCRPCGVFGTTTYLDLLEYSSRELVVSGGMISFVDILYFGHSPFKFCNSWLSFAGLNEVVLASWSSQPGDLHYIDRRLLGKLKNLKADIRVWMSHIRSTKKRSMTRFARTLRI
ncbi:hypothetical protein LXL04_024863 [Taraxacum kok-saghyz]